MSRAVDQLKQRAGAQSIALAGHSGGATMALLLAQRREDVRAVVSIAGVLDHGAWTDHHGVTPLKQSLRIDDQAHKLAQLPQAHFAGARDRVAPSTLMRRFIREYGPFACVMDRVAEQADHQNGWLAYWPELLAWGRERLARCAAPWRASGLQLR
ncbi:alpha/beta hydrolase [Magnetofaba australis]|nr:alpha/beta fold hydrolase [Magnetofaba australis]